MIPEQSLNLSGKVALISGAGVGIGRAVALALGKAGAIIGLHYYSQSKRYNNRPMSILFLLREDLVPNKE